MNTKELDDELESVRTRVIEEGCRTGGSREKQLEDVAEKLEAAKSAEVRDDIKASVIDCGNLILRANRLPPEYVFGNDNDSLQQKESTK